MDAKYLAEDLIENESELFGMKTIGVRGLVAFFRVPGGIYAYEHNYNTEKGYTVPKNTTIGKCTDDDSELMYPNTNIFESFSRLRKCRKPKGSAYRSGCLRAGPYLYCVRLLRSIAWMKCWEISLERTAVCF